MNRINMTLAGLLAVMLLACLFTPASAEPPVPNEAIIHWQLNITTKPVKPIMVTLPGKTKPELFWFMLFRVSNKTDEDILFTPQLELFTNTGQLLRAGKGVEPSVFNAIKKVYNEPLLRDATGFSGKILQGEDNAKIFVAIFKDFDPDASAFTIYITGLSGETAEIKLPKPIKVKEIGANGKTVTVQKDKILLLKTLSIKYALKTDAANRSKSAPVQLMKKWIMR